MEKSPKPQHDTLLSAYEAAYREPGAQRVLREAEEYNQLLQAEPIEPTELSDIRQELDRKWSPYMGQPVRVSGMVYDTVRNQRPVDDPGHFVEDLPLISNGFVGLTQPIYRNTETVDIKQQLRLHFFQQLPDQPVQNQLSADIPLVDLQFDNVSRERARAWLELEQPKIIDTIDDRVLNEQCRDEADALLNLRGFSIETQTDDEVDSMIQKCVSTYLNQLLQFDQDVPYVTTMYGRGYEQRQQKVHTIPLAFSDRLIRPLRVVLCGDTFQIGERNITTQHLYVGCRLFGAKRSQKPADYIVPLETFRALTPLRARYS